MAINQERLTMVAKTIQDKGLIGEARAVTLALNGAWHGYNGRVPCPLCDKSKHDTALMIKQDDQRITFHCFRCQEGRALFEALKPYATDHPINDKSTIKTKTSFTPSMALKLWQNAKPLTMGGEVIKGYLSGRGITTPPDHWPQALRWIHKLYHSPSKTYHPALIAGVSIWPSPEIIACQRIYIDSTDTEERAAIMQFDGDLDHDEALAQAIRYTPPRKLDIPPAKMTLGSLRGGAVKLGDTISPKTDLILCEGVEDALSIVFMTRGQAAVWATLGTSGLSGVILPNPDQFRKVIIFRDGDEASIKAGEKLQARHPEITIHITATPSGQDANSLLQERATHE